MWVGVFMICVGILIILSNMNILVGDVWDYVWPVFFILLGASMILKRVRRNRTQGPIDSSGQRTYTGFDNPPPPTQR